MGGGFSDFHVCEPYLVCCRSCEAVRNGNIKLHPLTCGSQDVASYMDPKIRQGAGTVLGTHGKLEITDAPYLCPRRGSYSVHFMVIAFLD
jgi:hypothetical protein